MVGSFNGFFKAFNPALSRALGYPEHILMSMPFINLVHPADQTKTQQIILEIKRGKEVVVFENRLVKKDGSIIRVMWSGVSSQDGESFFASGKDLTEQMNFCDDKTEKLNRIIHFSPGVIYSCYFDGNIRLNFVSDQISQFGYNPQQFLEDQTLWRNKVHPEDWPRIKKCLEEILVTGRCRHEYRFLDANGKYVWVRDEVSVAHDPNGGPAELIGFVNNINAEVLARTHYEQVFQAVDSSAIVAVTDLKGKIVFANDNFCQISGYSKDELIGKDHRILNSGFHSKEFFKEMWSSILSGKVWKGELRNKKKNGSYYWLQTTISPWWDYTHTKIEHFVSVRFDVTAEKEAQEMIIQNSKMTSLGEISAGIAHEINNPLAIIAGKVQLVRKLTEDGLKTGTIAWDKMKDACDRVEETVQRISKIIRGLRAFTRESGADPFVDVSINSILEDILSICEAHFRSKGVQVILPDLKQLNFHLECRPSQVAQVLLNLMNNAFDEVKKVQKKWIKIEVEDLGSDLTIRVIDSGPGVPEGFRKKLFQPFFTTKEVGKGTGLGLSISLGIIGAHQGNIYLDEQAPHTTFVILLPKKQARAQLA